MEVGGEQRAEEKSMLNKIVILAILIALSAASAVGLFNYPENIYIRHALYSSLALAILYIIFKLALEEVVAHNISARAARFSFRRVVSALFLVAVAIALTSIWTEAQNLLVAYGLVGAGIAFALQDIFKNLAGGLVLLIRGPYLVGDRIEINKKSGDVIDIDLMNTTLLEMGEWVSGDQPTGRLCLIPNGLVLSQPVHNYTRDHSFLWDETRVPVTYGSDWRLASDTMLKLATDLTRDVTQQAMDSISRLSSRYYLPERAEVPYVFMTPTDNWVNLTVRYITKVRERRAIRDTLNRFILAEFEKLGKEKVTVASATMTVTVEGKTLSFRPDTPQGPA